MEIAAAVGRPERGRAMVAEIERALADAVARRRPGSRPEQEFARLRDRLIAPSLGPGSRRGTVVKGPAVLLYISGDLANGSGTLLDDLLAKAGFRNAAADYGLAYTGTLPIETIAAHPPDVVLSPGDGRTADLRRRVLRRAGAKTVEARFPRRLMNCGGPAIPAALARLAAIRSGL